MYKVNPVLSDVNVLPNVTMYKLASIHGEVANGNFVDSHPAPTTKSLDPVADLASKQVQLIKQLVEFKKQLDSFLSPEIAAISLNDDQKSTGGGKVDKKVDKKAAKKESRAANKAAAKESGAKPTPSTTTAPFVLLTPSGSATLVKTTSTVNAFQVHKYNNVVPASFQCTLECQVADIKWLDSFIKVGKARGVELGPKATGKRSIVVKTAKTGLTNSPIQGRVAVWKTLGALLQVFDPVDGLPALRSDQWLQVANDLLVGRTSVDEVGRELSRRLGEVDFLGAHGVVLLPDLVLKPLLKNTRVANNVELWLGRVSTAL